MLINDVKYSIISINDRAADNMQKTRAIMSDFEEIKINSVNGNIENTSEILKKINISLKNWTWHSKPRGGEIGLWLSNINLFNKMINEDISNVLLLEDDTILSDNFINIFEKVVKEIPEDYDFISLVFPSSSKWAYRDDAEIGLENICIAKYNHFSTIAIMWSNKGAKKMIDFLDIFGIKHPIDIYLYEFLVKEDMLKGYSIKPDVEKIIFHDWDRYESTIDLDGHRGSLSV